MPENSFHTTSTKYEYVKLLGSSMLLLHQVCNNTIINRVPVGDDLGTTTVTIKLKDLLSMLRQGGKAFSTRNPKQNTWFLWAKFF